MWMGGTWSCWLFQSNVSTRRRSNIYTPRIAGQAWKRLGMWQGFAATLARLSICWSSGMGRLLQSTRPKIWVVCPAYMVMLHLWRWRGFLRGVLKNDVIDKGACTKKLVTWHRLFVICTKKIQAMWEIFRCNPTKVYHWRLGCNEMRCDSDLLVTCKCLPPKAASFSHFPVLRVVNKAEKFYC